MFGALITFITTTGAAVANAVSSIGSALSTFVTKVAPVLGEVIDALTPVAEAIGRFANAFLQGLGIIKPDEKIEDFGERALQAAEDGITIDKYDNFTDYMDALRKYPLDTSIKHTQAEKIVSGLGLGSIIVEDKFGLERGSMSSFWLLPIVNPEYFTPDRVQGLATTGKLCGDIAGYLEKRLSGGEARSFEQGLEIGSDGKPMTETEQSKLYSALDTARDRWADLAKQVEAKQSAAQGA